MTTRALGFTSLLLLAVAAYGLFFIASPDRVQGDAARIVYFHVPMAWVAFLAFFVVFWMVYDGICQVFGRRKNGDTIVGVLIAIFIAFATWLACQWFAGRAAFLLVGAMMATTMSGNVFFWIIPGQRKMVDAMLRNPK